MIVKLPPKRIKIDVYDDEGNKITVSFEGVVSKNKVIQLLDLIEIMSGVHSLDKSEPLLMSKFDKVKQIIMESFPIGSFKSQDIQNVYEDLFNEPIGLSTVSTYLARLTHRGFLIRSGSPTKIFYRIKRKVPLSKSQDRR